jgi:hypothetical protein
VKRAPFDLGLWAICTALAFAFVGATLSDWRDPWNGFRLVVLTVAGLCVGCGLYGWLQSKGWRISRPRPEQAEDYEEPRP